MVFAETGQAEEEHRPKFLTCLHVQGCSLSVMTGIEHRHSFVDGLLDDVIRVACDFFGFGDQNRIDDVDDSV